ncbi:MAG: FlgO family outer membrane protein [Desulfobulbaceae bacterium]|nr:FlgO family outer membrane protein [Desulfobulbaceae bacterium]
MMTNSVPTAAAPAVNYIQPPPLGAPAGGPVAPFASTAAAVPNNAIAPVPAGYVAPAPVVPEPKVEPENPLPSSLAKTVPAIYKYSPDASQSLGTEKQLSEFCREIAGKVYYELKQNGSKHLTSRVAVVDAVPLSDLKRETEFGRLISEYMLTDLADRGLKVTELRLGREINILPQTGEFILSRNIGELASDAPMLDYVLVSTFTNTRKTLILQGRLVGLKSGLVETSWRYTLPLNRELLGLFNASDEQPFTIAVNGMSR